MDICSIIGGNIRKLRTDQGLSQEELAFRAEIDRSYLSEIENGYKNLSVEVLAQLAQALDINICDLFVGHRKK